MLKRLLNECVLSVELLATGRLLVKEPPEDTDARYQGQSGAIRAARPVHTKRPDGSDGLYLPGASLKGAWRTQAERIARTLNAHGAGACDPFMVLPRDGSQPAPDLACSERMIVRERHQQRLRREDSSVQPLPVAPKYSAVCPICRTFGHLGWGRRLRVTDFYPMSTPESLQMTHISVDRVAGGVATPYLGSHKYGSGRTFTLQYAYQARLVGQIILENFELWQLGLLGLLWRDMVDGLLPVGHKQTTGAGELQPYLRQMQLTRLGSRPTEGELRGVGALFAGAADYGYGADDDTLAWPGLHWTQSPNDVRWQATLEQPAAEELWASLAEKAAGILQNHRWPDEMAVARIVEIASREVTR
jgi:CRISPR-associated protein Csm3